jgi:hypothetical protein
VAQARRAHDRVPALRLQRIVTAAAAALALAAPAIAAKPQPSFPIRAAFYYGWYPEGWGALPYTRYTPALGYYDSGSAAIVRGHIDAMLYAGIDAGIYSWWGPRLSGNGATSRFPLYLQAARPTPFKWTVYYEEEGYADPDPAAIAADLRVIKENYARHPSYLRVGGRFVVFVYGGAGDGCATAARWNEANTLGAYIVLRAVWVDSATLLADLQPYDAAFAGGVRVAAADLTGDGRVELLTAAGPGAPPQVDVFAVDGSRAVSFLAGDASERAGVYIAAGDVTGDRAAEIVTGSDNPLSSRIDVFTPAGERITSFDAGLAGGVRVAVGDVTGDRRAEIIAAPGPVGGQAVKIFDGRGTLLSTFGAHDPAFGAGVSVAAGDVTGDGRAEIVTASADGLRNEIRVFAADGRMIVPPFTPFTPSDDPLSVAVGDVNGDGVGDVAAAAAGGPRVRSFTLRGGVASALGSFYAFDPARVGQNSVAVGDGAIVVGSAPGYAPSARVFGSFRDCPNQPDAWHEYEIASGESSIGSSFTVSPGFFRPEDAVPFLMRDLARWRRNVRAMARSRADWQLVVSFNEWGEGTSIERAQEWAQPGPHGAYLQALRQALAAGASPRRS